VRWLLEVDVPLSAACVLFTLDPQDAPMGMGDVAETIGVSVEDAAQALKELRSLGYAREDGRQYEPTKEGERLHASLTSARRAALATFLESLTERQRRDLAQALSKPR
jgi:predicted transcriptional regulator